MNETVLFDYPYSLFLMERLEFVLLCQDELEAKILRIVEYEMMRARDAQQGPTTANSQGRNVLPPESPMLWVQLSHAQFLSRLYKYDTSKVGARQPLSMSRGTLRKAINSLLAKQLLFVRARPGDEFGAPEYTLNRPLIQEKLYALPKDPFHVFCPGRAASPEPERHLQNSHLPPAHSNKGDLQNTQLPPPTGAHPQVQNLHIFKYTKQESLKENKESCNSDVAHMRTFTNDFFSLLTFITALTPEQKRQLTRALFIPQGFSYSHVGGGGVRSSDREYINNISTINEHNQLKTEHLLHMCDSPEPITVGTALTASTPMTESVVSVAGELTPPLHEQGPGAANTSYSHNPPVSASASYAVVSESPLPIVASVAGSCTQISLIDATPIAPPEKPSQDKPWTPQTCLELADYYRGETLPKSIYKDSAYQRAARAAVSLVSKQQATYSQVDAVFRYMCGRDETLKDTWWADKKVDLWHVAEHCSAKLREIERKSHPPNSAPPQPSEWSSVLLSEEKRQRNFERLRALAAARTSLRNPVGTGLITYAGTA